MIHAGVDSSCSRMFHFEDLVASSLRHCMVILPCLTSDSTLVEASATMGRLGSALQVIALDFRKSNLKARDMEIPWIAYVEEEALLSCPGSCSLLSSLAMMLIALMRLG